MKTMLKRILWGILGTLAVMPFVASAVNVTVPAAPSSGFYLISTSTGAYIYTWPNPLVVGTISATSTGTSTFSGGVTAANLNTTGTASSTFSNGIILNGGCLYQNGACLSAGGTGTVTSVASSNGITGGTITSSGTLSLVSYIATSSLETNGNLAYWTTSSGNPAKLGTVATSSLGVTSPITFSGTLGAQVGGVGGNFACATCNTSNASVSSVASASGITGGTITTTGTLSLVNWIATSSADTAGQVTFFGTTNNWPAKIQSSSNVTYATSTGVLTVNSASSTNLSIGSYMAAPFQQVPVYIASSTWGTGTTTVTLLNLAKAITALTESCNTSAGTLDIDLYYGSTHILPMVIASTTNGVTTFTTNTVVAKGSTIKMDIGTAASSPTTVNCTPLYVYNQSN